ncbi:MAG: TlyA family RNA methyltransferase [Candidatus Polarisedimenticolia bacterium]
MAAPPVRRRLDVVMVERGLAPSRQTAQALIMAGRVLVGGRAAAHASDRVADDVVVEVTQPLHPYVGRGGVKLAGALDAFGVDVAGWAAIDVGASTGGFTDCLLQRGAVRVHAVDVGRGQLDWRLRRDPRVVVVEGLNARSLVAADLPGLGEGADIVVADVSFISLKLILPCLPPLLRAGGAIILLVKPQFEVGRHDVGAGGIVREPALRARAVVEVARRAVELGLGVHGMAASQLAGAEGNQEFFLHLRPGPGGWPLEEIERHAVVVTGA